MVKINQKAKEWCKNIANDSQYPHPPDKKAGLKKASKEFNLNYTEVEDRINNQKPLLDSWNNWEKLYYLLTGEDIYHLNTNQ